LDLLGFIRPNRDFSMGYGGKNKKIVSPFSSAPCPPAGREFDCDQWKTSIARILIFAKKLHEIICAAAEHGPPRRARGILALEARLHDQSSRNRPVRRDLAAHVQQILGMGFICATAS
jgi:hypothetical protein